MNCDVRRRVRMFLCNVPLVTLRHYDSISINVKLYEEGMNSRASVLIGEWENEENLGNVRYVSIRITMELQIKKVDKRECW